MANVKGGRYVESLYFSIVNPRTGQEHFPSSNGNWRFNNEKINELINNSEIYFGEDDQGRPKLKRFLCDVKEGITWTTLWDFVPLNTSGSQEMANIFGNQSTFENPKPTGLITEVIKVGLGSNDIILDFFSGSSTTAHAVLEQNKEDGGNRKFICVQLPEKCDENSEAFKAGYKTIAEIGKERIRRVIKKIQEEQDGKLDLDGNGNKDLGFKVFKLKESNFKIWRSNIETEEELVAQMQRHLEPLDEHANTEDVLYELLIKSGVPLTAKIKEEKGYILVNDNEIALMLERADDKIIKQIIAAKPQKIFTLDRLFKNNDKLKTNTALQMKDAGIEFKVI
jgi:adenine-specific DNA-methyltransferase